MKNYYTSIVKCYSLCHFVCFNSDRWNNDGSDYL